MSERASNGKQRLRVIWGILLLTLLQGCAAKKPAPAPEPVPLTAGEIELRRTSLEISYILGHTVHRFVTTAGPSQVQAETFRDQQRLKQSIIDPAKYSELVRQAGEVMTTLQTRPITKAGTPCRTPFTLKLRSEREIRAIEGCRTADTGAQVGRLIKNAEFLLYSND